MKTLSILMFALVVCLVFFTSGCMLRTNLGVYDRGYVIETAPVYYYHPTYYRTRVYHHYQHYPHHYRAVW